MPALARGVRTQGIGGYTNSDQHAHRDRHNRPVDARVGHAATRASSSSAAATTSAGVPRVGNVVPTQFGDHLPALAGRRVGELCRCALSRNRACCSERTLGVAKMPATPSRQTRRIAAPCRRRFRDIRAPETNQDRFLRRSRTAVAPSPAATRPSGAGSGTGAGLATPNATLSTFRNPTPGTIVSSRNSLIPTVDVRPKNARLGRIPGRTMPVSVLPPAVSV
jgi:hypothetical protein